MLQIHNLNATIGNRPILKGLTLALLCASASAQAQMAPLSPPTGGSAVVNDRYATCLMVGVGQRYPDGPTGTQGERLAAIDAVKDECAPTKREVDAEATKTAARNRVPLAAVMKNVTEMRTGIENTVRMALGLPALRK
jgi:hypothetical protein